MGGRGEGKPRIWGGEGKENLEYGGERGNRNSGICVIYHRKISFYVLEINLI
jgi:hypothetical protein